jgi:hypothetical protein
MSGKKASGQTRPREGHEVRGIHGPRNELREVNLVRHSAGYSTESWWTPVAEQRGRDRDPRGGRRADAGPDRAPQRPPLDECGRGVPQGLRRAIAGAISPVCTCGDAPGSTRRRDPPASRRAGPVEPARGLEGVTARVARWPPRRRVDTRPRRRGAVILRRIASSLALALLSQPASAAKVPVVGSAEPPSVRQNQRESSIHELIASWQKLVPTRTLPPPW